MLPFITDTDMTSETDTPELESSNMNMAEANVFGMKPNSYCMLLHLSQLLNLLSGGMTCAGVIAPIVLWAIAKDRSVQVDEHGKIALNWQISYLIYMAVSVALCLAIIGVFILAVVWVLGIVFPIIGAVKANEGTVWKYPLSIPFFK